MKRKAGLLLAVCMLLVLLPVSVLADTPIGTVVVSVEKFALGDGYLVEPTFVDIYSGDTAATLLLRLLEQKNIGCGHNGSGEIGSGFYLQKIEDSPTLNVPEKLLEKMGDDFNSADNNDEYLGEFDYTFMSGWMISVNSWFCGVGADQISTFGSGANELSDGDVIRWQYTLYGYGADIGGGYSMSGTSSNFYDVESRDALTYSLAEASANTAWKNANTAIYNAALAQCSDLFASEAELLAAQRTLQSAVGTTKRILVPSSYASSGNDIVLSKKNGIAGDVISVQASCSDDTMRVSEVYANGKPLPETAVRGVFSLTLGSEHIQLSAEYLEKTTLKQLEFGNLNRSGTVDGEDFSTLLLHYGKTAAREDGDLNNNNVVDGEDLSLLLLHYGKTSD